MSSANSSVLNQVTIKQLTEAVIQSRGGHVDRTNPNRWSVELPPELATERGSTRTDRKNKTGDSSLDSIVEDVYSDDESKQSYETTLVFDPRDEHPGEEDIIVRPGTSFFNSLLELAREGSEVAYLHLGADDLQMQEPPLCDALGADSDVIDFEAHETEAAVAFHFHLQLKGAQSYHKERFKTVTIDVGDGKPQPELTDRLHAHFGELATAAEPSGSSSIGAEIIEELYDESINVLQDRVHSDVEDLRAEASEAASERVTEIRELYEQRREELDEEVDKKEQEVAEYRHKFQNARKRETKKRYRSNFSEAQDELDELVDQVDQRKAQLREEEREQIAQTTDRHAVGVDVANIGTTVITYDVGTLRVRLQDEGRVGETAIGYTPATNTFETFSCDDCGVGFEADRPPVVCDGGHVVCPDCRVGCAECGTLVCGATTGTLAACTFCGTAECADCQDECASCGRTICSTHRDRRATDNEPVCTLCGTDCKTCGAFYDDSQLNICESTVDTHCLVHFGECDCTDSWTTVDCGHHCTDHIDDCDVCSNATCDEHLEECIVCDGGFCRPDRVTAVDADGSLCPDHADYCRYCDGHHTAGSLIKCSVDGDSVCEDHADRCEICDEVACEEHLKTCVTCDSAVCSNHAETCAACGGMHCADHTTICDVCEEPFGTEHAESCVRCEDAVCPSDRHTCEACGEIFCTPHTTPCTDCQDRFCYSHAEGCATCKSWTCHDHLTECTVCEMANCGLHTDNCTVCDEALCPDHAIACTQCGDICCADDASTCSVCSEPVCPSHAGECEHCDTVICPSDSLACTECGTTQCPDHVETCHECQAGFCPDHITECAECQGVICQDDASLCAACNEPFGISHLASCTECGDQLCSSHRETCQECGDWLCQVHAEACGTDDAVHCGRHLVSCERCQAETEEIAIEQQYCTAHVVNCCIGQEFLCGTHAERDPIVGEMVCAEHTDSCGLCGRDYAITALEHGRCKTCHRIGEDEIPIPKEITNDFRSVRGARNDAYTIIYGKRLLGANQLVVIDRETNKELDRRTIGFVERLQGVFK